MPSYLNRNGGLNHQDLLVATVAAMDYYATASDFRRRAFHLITRSISFLTAQGIPKIKQALDDTSSYSRLAAEHIHGNSLSEKFPAIVQIFYAQSAIKRAIRAVAMETRRDYSWLDRIVGKYPKDFLNGRAEELTSDQFEELEILVLGADKILR
jgi:hypothetical protein